MIFRRLFRRQDKGPSRPAPFLRDLISVLKSCALNAQEAEPDPLLYAAGRSVGARSQGLLQISNGPPDFLHATRTGATRGDLGSVAVTGFHWLTRRDRLSQAWPEGRVEAKREFSAGQVGAARRFRWTATDDSAPSRAAASMLRDLAALNDRLLRLLQDPGVLVLEVAPEAESGVLRVSLHLGNRDWLDEHEVQTLRDLCRALVAPAGDRPAH